MSVLEPDCAKVTVGIKRRRIKRSGMWHLVVCAFSVVLCMGKRQVRFAGTGPLSQASPIKAFRPPK